MTIEGLLAEFSGAVEPCVVDIGLAEVTRGAEISEHNKAIVGSEKCQCCDDHSVHMFIVGDTGIKTQVIMDGVMARELGTSLILHSQAGVVVQ